MALTKIGTDGVKDDAVTTDKLANAINTERTANTAKVSTTINNNADNRVITGSGTANTLEGESNLTFSGSALGVTGTTAITGNTSVGTTTQNWRFQAFGGRSTFTDTTAYALGIRKNSAQDADHNFWLGGAAADDNTHPDLVFSDNSGSEKFRFRQSGGLCFNGDTAAANALDDYEEGTFTPTFYYVSGTSGVAYSTQEGRYTKIGRLVTIQIRIALSNAGTGNNEARVGGLPFTPATGGVSYDYFHLSTILGANLGSGKSPFIQLEDHSSGGRLTFYTYDYSSSTNYGTFGASEIADNFNFSLTGTYITA